MEKCMNDIKKYEMSKWKHCAAKTRPTECFYPQTNICCFNCEKNEECTNLNWENKQKVIPCKLDMRVQDFDGHIQEFALFEEMERCEWSV